MITIRHNTYNDGELETLLTIFESSRAEFEGQECLPSPRDLRCCDCSVRHICYDLDSAIAYLRKEVNK